MSSASHTDGGGPDVLDERDEPEPPAIPARSRGGGRDWDVCDECGGEDVAIVPDGEIANIDLRCEDSGHQTAGWGA